MIMSIYKENNNTVIIMIKKKKKQRLKIIIINLTHAHVEAMRPNHLGQ